MDNEKFGEVKVPRRILSAVLTSLKAGVVPRSGTPYIAIGRQKEIEALLSDLSTAAEGGSAIRFIIGRYGSGKSFLLQLIRGYAAEKGFVCFDADLSPERRLYGTGGSGVATYRELLRNMASKTSPDGGALQSVIARQLTCAREQVMASGVLPDAENFPEKVREVLSLQLRELRLSVGGFDFSTVIGAYFSALTEENDDKAAACLQWLRGEFTTRGEAKRALGFSVSSIVDDDNWYDFIKLWAVYVRICGYKGAVMFLDECVNLYKITNRVSRENNYEKLLAMFNDALGARAPGLVMLFGGTPQFLEDTRRGLFGYEALRSRLCDSRFADGSFETVNGPVIRLRRLSDDEMFALILRVQGLHRRFCPTSPSIGAEEAERFYRACRRRAGADEMMTPREMIRDWLYVLDTMAQDASVSFDRFIKDEQTEKTPETAPNVRQTSGGQTFGGRGTADTDPEEIEI